MLVAGKLAAASGWWATRISRSIVSVAPRRATCHDWRSDTPPARADAAALLSGGARHRATRLRDGGAYGGLAPARRRPAPATSTGALREALQPLDTGAGARAAVPPAIQHGGGFRAAPHTSALGLAAAIERNRERATPTVTRRSSAARTSRCARSPLSSPARGTRQPARRFLRAARGQRRADAAHAGGRAGCAWSLARHARCWSALVTRRPRGELAAAARALPTQRPTLPGALQNGTCSARSRRSRRQHARGSSRSAKTRLDCAIASPWASSWRTFCSGREDMPGGWRASPMARMRPGDWARFQGLETRGAGATGAGGAGRAGAAGVALRHPLGGRSRSFAPA